jgi:hypothetical protein
VVRVDRDEAVDELAEAVAGRVRRVVGRDLEQVALGIDAEHGELVDERGVEDDVGPILEGEDVALFPPPDGRPASNALVREVAALVPVADDSPEKPDVLRENAREAVEG